MAKKKTARSKSNSYITVFMLLVIIGLGVYYMYTGNDLLGLFTTAETPVVLAPDSPTNTPAMPGSSGDVMPVTGYGGLGDGWAVYFADPINLSDPENYGDTIEQKLIDRITAAQQSIYIASFEFDLTPVADALVAAKKRGVDIKWVTDDEHGIEADEEPGHGQFAMLEEAGIEVRDDGRTALMHNKFWIFDEKTVWTGSTNITINGIFKQNNNVIVVESPELAAIYLREFNEIWDGEHGPRSPSTYGQQTTIINGMQVEALFASEDPVIDRIIEIVSGAKSNIRFMAFSFTDYPLAKSMIDRAADGVDVAGVFEKVGSETQYAELSTLYCAKVPVRQDGNPSFLHHKLIIVDESIVITGSLNFSSSASDSNDENVIIVYNPDIAKLYIDEFNRVWEQGADPDPADLQPCQ